jgi:outer membrane protein assembly factor BamB
VWAAGTVAVLVAAVLLWRGSDAAATTSTTAAPPLPATGSPAAGVRQAWSAPAGTQPEQVLTRGRVVVGDAHGLAALDPVTGRAAWRYERSNARLCGLTAVDGYAVAVFNVPGETHRCDQVVALDVGTGVRQWTRNVNFSPDVALTGVDRSGQAAGSVVAYSPTGLVDIDPVGDNIRWRYHAAAGCRLSDVTPGTAGIAFVQRCAGGAPQLRFVDPTGGGTRWTKELTGAPRVAGADGAVTVVDGGTLRVLSADDGAERSALPLPGGSTTAPAAAPAELPVGDLDLVSAGGAVTALDPATGQQRWQVPAVGAAGPVAGTPGSVVVPEDGAFVVRDAGTGAERGRSALPGPPAGGTAAAIGPVVAYRLPDRVLGFR